ncbi:MAG TPA: MarR family transcriptional regulator [Dongiaceae bacterium]|jgi:DNA-binding MarR family transcriptional regulator|nr:MarR family transcriptional regulator [Dongiaceae bacterium]
MPRRPDSRAKAGGASPSAADYRALASFRYTLRKFLAFSENAAKGVGLTPQQHQALLTIMGYPEPDAVTIGALAERLLLKHHSTVELVDRLTELELVKRVRDTADRRRVILRLTRKAQQLLSSLSAAHLEELRRFRPVFAALLERLDE